MTAVAKKRVGSVISAAAAAAAAAVTARRAEELQGAGARGLV